MTELTDRSVHYSYEGTELIGYFVADSSGAKRPGVLLIHDAFGVSDAMKGNARRIAELGYSVFLADLWGDGRTPMGDDEIGPLIGSMVSNSERWTALVKAGHDQLLAQEEVAEAPVTAAGYCFGGSSVLEYVRVGGEVEGAVSFHGGLDVVGTDWTRANRNASVLILTGAEDPMAPQTVVDALQESMTRADVAWEVASYGQTKHAFTNPHADKAGKPEVIAYNPRADRRSWNAFTLFLQETLESAGANA